MPRTFLSFPENPTIIEAVAYGLYLAITAETEEKSDAAQRVVTPMFYALKPAERKQAKKLATDWANA